MPGPPDGMLHQQQSLDANLGLLQYSTSSTLPVSSSFSPHDLSFVTRFGSLEDKFRNLL